MEKLADETRINYGSSDITTGPVADASTVSLNTERLESGSDVVATGDTILEVSASPTDLRIAAAEDQTATVARIIDNMPERENNLEHTTWAKSAGTELYPLVEIVARNVHRETGGVCELSDLVGMGAIGLVRGIGDLDSDYAPSQARSYLLDRIRGSIRDEMRRHGVGHQILSRGGLRHVRNETSIRELMLSGGHDYDKAAELLGHTTGSIVARNRGLASAASTLSSLSTTLSTSTDGDVTLADSVIGLDAASVEASVLEASEANALHSAIEALDERHRDVINDYYFGNKKLAEIGEQLGVSEARACQIKRAAEKMLHSLLGSQE